MSDTTAATSDAGQRHDGWMGEPWLPGDVVRLDDGSVPENLDIVDFLNQPAEEDPADEVTAWMQFAVCPECRAAYPDFYSPTGSLHTFCDNCGWSSEGDGPTS